MCKVLKTLLTLFVFFLRLSFGLYILKSSFNSVRHVLGNIQYKNNKKKTLLIVILFFLYTRVMTGLEITAGQRTMSGLIVDLTGQTFVLPVMLTGQNSIVLKMK